jgi:hypothetical protein
VTEVVGWREWVSLPDLGIDAIKAKVDTGARTSSLHAFDVELKTRRGVDWVHFKVHPLQHESKRTVSCKARLLEQRLVKSSTGHQQLRPVVETVVDLDGESWPIELTLTSRELMGFRMLLGRTAIRKRFLVDPGRSFLWKRHKPPGKKKKKKKRNT